MTNKELFKNKLSKIEQERDLKKQQINYEAVKQTAELVKTFFPKGKIIQLMGYKGEVVDTDEIGNVVIKATKNKFEEMFVFSVDNLDYVDF